MSRREVIVTADDFGLTLHANSTILAVADAGRLGEVSVLANGYAVPEALAAWRERQPNLALSVHFNLTEGSAVSHPVDIPHLVNPDGTFRHSAFSLLVASLLALPKKRQALFREVRRELLAQIAVVSGGAGAAPLAVNGHQHVHMIPLVFRVIVDVHSEQPFSRVRLPREVLYIPRHPFSSVTVLGALRHIGLNALSRYNERQATKAGLSHPDYFVGTLQSGSLNLADAEAALVEVARKDGQLVELGFHPGIAGSGELVSWKGDCAWHYAPQRKQEYDALMDVGFSSMISRFVDRTIMQKHSRLLEIGRFIVAGGLATGTNLAALFVLVDVAHVWYIASAILAYGIATVIGFSLQKFWAFSHNSLTHTKREVLWFVLNNALGLAFDAVALYVLVEYAGLWYMAAQFIALALIALWNFFIYRFVIFPRSSHLTA